MTKPTPQGAAVRLRKAHAADVFKPSPSDLDIVLRAFDAANAEIAQLKGVVGAMDRGLQLIAGQCGTPDSADGCRLILRTVARVREAARIKMEEHTGG